MTAASAAVAATSAVAVAAVAAAVAAVAAAVALLEAVPGARVVEAPEPEGLEGPAARVASVPVDPVAVREVRPGSVVAPASVRTRSASGCWMAAFRSRTPGEWPSF